jgi:hypothetical protein
MFSSRTSTASRSRSVSHGSGSPSTWSSRRASTAPSVPSLRAARRSPSFQRPRAIGICDRGAALAGALTGRVLLSPHRFSATLVGVDVGSPDPKERETTRVRVVLADDSVLLRDDLEPRLVEQARDALANVFRPETGRSEPEPGRRSPPTQPRSRSSQRCVARLGQPGARPRHRRECARDRRREPARRTPRWRHPSSTSSPRARASRLSTRRPGGAQATSDRKGRL